jgi:hypothetical protein
MYAFLECLMVVALVAMVAMLLFAACVAGVALGQGLTVLWRVARKAARPAIASETGLSLVLQGVVLTSTEPPAR